MSYKRKIALFNKSIYNKGAFYITKKSYIEIGEISYALLCDIGFETPPIHVEKIVDNIFKKDIIPIPSFKTAFGYNSRISYDFSDIYVDETIYKKAGPQYKYSLARELGHIVLHRHIFCELNMLRIKDYKNFVKSMNIEAIDLLDVQSKQFAELILVPSIPLRNHFKKLYREKRECFDKFQNHELYEAHYKKALICTIATDLIKIFNVDLNLIKKRIDKDRLIKLIP